MSHSDILFWLILSCFVIGANILVMGILDLFWWVWDKIRSRRNSHE